MSQLDILLNTVLVHMYLKFYTVHSLVTTVHNLLVDDRLCNLPSCTINKSKDCSSGAPSAYTAMEKVAGSSHTRSNRTASGQIGHICHQQSIDKIQM